MSDTAKIFTIICLSVLVVVGVVFGVNYFTNKNKGPTWIDKIFTGDVAPEVEVVDTGFKVYSTNNGLAVVDPGSGVVTEDGTALDYANALYVDMTADSGYYPGSQFGVYKDFSGSFLYTDLIGKKHMLYNQLFKDGNHTIGYVAKDSVIVEYASIEKSDYLQDMTVMKNGTTYHLTPKMSVFETNAMFYNMCTYAISQSSCVFGTYVIVLDVTDYFVVKNGDETITSPILFSYTVDYVNDKMSSVWGNFNVTSKIFEMTAKAE